MPRKKKDYGLCPVCGAALNKFKKKYCSNRCQHEDYYRRYIDEWKQGRKKGGSILKVSRHIRRYLFEKFGNKCPKCSWCEVNPVSGNVPLEVDHIDGDWRNNREENLGLLCPNCHSLTTTYGALNRGRGRHRVLVGKESSDLTS